MFGSGGDYAPFKKQLQHSSHDAVFEEECKAPYQADRQRGSGLLEASITQSTLTSANLQQEAAIILGKFNNPRPLSGWSRDALICSQE